MSIENSSIASTPEAGLSVTAEPINILRTKRGQWGFLGRLVGGVAAGVTLVSPLGRAISGLANSPEGGAEDPVRVELEAKGLKVESWNALTTGPDGQQKSVTLRIAYKEYSTPEQDYGITFNLANLDGPKEVKEQDLQDPQKATSRVALGREEVEKLMLASDYQNLILVEDDSPEPPASGFGVAYAQTIEDFRKDRTFFNKTTWLAQPEGFPAKSLVAKTWFNKSGRPIAASAIDGLNRSGVAIDFVQASQDYKTTQAGTKISVPRGTSDDIAQRNVEAVFQQLNLFQVAVPPSLVQQPNSAIA